MKAWGASTARRSRASVVLPLLDGPERPRRRVCGAMGALGSGLDGWLGDERLGVRAVVAMDEWNFLGHSKKNAVKISRFLEKGLLVTNL